MFQSWKLGTKITAGFALLGILLLVTGGIGWFGATKLGDSIEYLLGTAWDTADGAMEGTIMVESQIIMANRIVNKLNVKESQKALAEARKVGAEAFERMAKAGMISADRGRAILAQYQAYNAALDQYLDKFFQMDKVAREFDAHTNKFVAFGEAVEEVGDGAVEAIEKNPDKSFSWNTGLAERWGAADGGMEANIGHLWSLFQIGRLLDGVEVEETKKKIAEALEFQAESAKEIKEGKAFAIPADTHGFPGKTMGQAYWDLYNGHQELIGRYIAAIDLFKAAEAVYQTKSKEFLGFVEEVEEEGDSAIEAISAPLAQTVATISTTIIITLVVAIVLAILLSYFITRSITKPLNRIIETMTAGSNHLETASGQVAVASQELAEGASEQAASIEETSSSLEEMSSMVRATADNSREADGLTDQAGQTMEEADRSMAGLSESMDRISESGAEISKIVKSIDEIAFQTNLLALNAAVEAARAGEAGAGFAVVADEVRNLAMRAAEAAKDTQALVEDTSRRISDGAELVTQTKSGFEEVTGQVTKASSLVTEIAAAASEQAQGIDQLNTAVSQMDRVVQNNAASAEESSSASQELNSLADQLRVMVGELSSMVGGSGSAAAVKPGGSETAKQISERPAAKPPAAQEVIPFDEDLEDF